MDLRSVLKTECKKKKDKDLKFNIPLQEEFAKTVNIFVTALRYGCFRNFSETFVPPQKKRTVKVKIKARSIPK